MKTNEQTYYKRNLPHYQSRGLVYFITFRLVDSLPNYVVLKLKQEKEAFLKELENVQNVLEKEEEYRLYQSRLFAKYESLIDKSNCGPKWLEDDRVAQIVFDSLKSMDSILYDLIACTIMPNHVHILIKPKENEKQDIELSKTYYIITEILKKIKGTTARQCNIILNRQGSFWQHESYDHIVRNITEQENIIKYILNNPIKIKLADKPENFRWNYCNYSYL